MVVGEVATATDVVVIGGGPGGYTAAVEAAKRGKRVTLVERDRIGGTCLNVGCIPSKALIHVAESMHQARAASAWGVDATAVVDLARAKAWSDGVVAQLTGGVEKLLRSHGVTIIEGTARFAGARRLAVARPEGLEHLDFDSAIIATGSRPIELKILPFDGKRIIDSTAALALTTLPSTMAVVGGGYIGVELGTAYAKLGTRVTIVEALDHVLPAMDPGLGAVVARRLKALGVEVITGSPVEGADAKGLVLAGGRSVEADVIVVAVGRRPCTDSLGLEHTPLTLDAAKLINVEPSRRASKHVLAIGDVTAGPALAHKASAEALVAARTAAGERAAFDPAAIPMVVFSDPEVVSVGLTTAAAREGGLDAKSMKFPFTASGRARTLAATDGYVELVTDADGTVVGGHAVGVGVSELAGELALAIEMAATATDVAFTIHPHPTLSESVMEAAQRLAASS